MAKIVRKKVYKTSSVKKVEFKTNQKKKGNCSTKECTVKLDRMSESFIRSWLKPNTHGNNIKIRSDQLKTNNAVIASASPSVSDIGIQTKKGNMFIAETKPIVAEKAVSSVKTNTPVQQSKSDKHIVKTLIQLVNESWKEIVRQKKQSKIILKENDIIMAKMKGYSPWPGKIVSFSKNRKRAEVYFYGSHNKGSVDVNDMVLFEDSHKVIRFQLLRVLSEFKKGILEVEYEMNVPNESSITNEMNAIVPKKTEQN